MSKPKLLQNKLLRSLIFPLILLVIAGGIYFYLAHLQGRGNRRRRMTVSS